MTGPRPIAGMEAFAVLFVLALIGGYVLGLVGFFRALSAHVELRELRRALIQLQNRFQAELGPPVSMEEVPIMAPSLPATRAAPSGARAMGSSVPAVARQEDAMLAAEQAARAAFTATAPPAMATTDTGLPVPDAAPASTASPGTASPDADSSGIVPSGTAPPGGVPTGTIPPPWAEPPIGPAPVWDLESLLTMRWGVWLGSAALLLAGVFLIRYAVEEDLLGPATRCAAAALLGLALLGAAEWLFRRDVPVAAGPFRTDQAPAGLAAGGTAILFAAAYGFGPFYDLVPPLVAFAAMALTSFLAMAASLRYGPLTAATGLAGAFMTPALIGSQNPSLPGLFTYLLLVSAAALAVMRYTAWTWLGWATAFAGGAWVWGAATAFIHHGPDPWAAAVFVPAAAALNLIMLPPAALDHKIGRRLAWIPFAWLGFCGLVVEAVAPGIVPRLALFALCPLAIWKGVVEPRMDRLPWVAALLGWMLLLIWDVPNWNPTGEAVLIEGIVQAIIPGAWAPAEIRPLIAAMALFAAFHAGVGLWLERRAPRPLHWAALVAAVPVLTLIAAHGRIGAFQRGFFWAGLALALAAALTAIAAKAASENTQAAAGNARQRAGVHAAGAAAALALGCAMLLHDQWLTLSIALFLPALAWIEAKADLPPLRRVALAVATLVLIRLLANWYVLEYDFGGMKLANGLIAAYAVPAAAFALAAFLFRRRADDLLVAVLEGGAATFAGIFVSLEIRHWFSNGQGLSGPVDFEELVLHLLTMGVQAMVYLHIAQRTGRTILEWAWRILGGATALGACLVLVFNPGVTGERAGIFTLLVAYAVPALLAVIARHRLASPGLRQFLGAYALAAGFVWITLQVHQVFHPTRMSLFQGRISDAEFWSWSCAWLLYGIALMARGIQLRDRMVRMTALSVIALVCLKVFLFDMAGLTGLWRVLSFLGLGLALIGLGAVYRRFVLPGRQAAEAAAGGVERETPAV